MQVIERDVRDVVAPTQMCVGVPSACKVASHAIQKAFDHPSTQAVLLVDASNAFNAVNRLAALHNIPRVCPAAGRVFVNTYSHPIKLFLSGGGVLLSQEGTCQGDPLAMAFYALAVCPLIRKLSSACQNTSQVWYADDDAAVGDLQDLRQYWEHVSSLGPAYGYHPNATKSVVLVKPELEVTARQVFGDTALHVTAVGTMYLGAPVGTESFMEERVRILVQQRCSELQTCAQVANTQPHALYHVFVNALQHKWLYLQRVAAVPSALFRPLDETICLTVLPAITGQLLSEDDDQRRLVALPARNGGLNIPIPSSCAAAERSHSLAVTQPLVTLLLPSYCSAVSDQDTSTLRTPPRPPSSPAGAPTAVVPSTLGYESPCHQPVATPPVVDDVSPSQQSSTTSPDVDFVSPTPPVVDYVSPSVDYVSPSQQSSTTSPDVDFVSPTPPVVDYVSPSVDYVSPSQQSSTTSPDVDFVSPTPPVVDYVSPSEQSSTTSPDVDFIVSPS